MKLKEVFSQTISGPWQTEQETDTQYRIEENDENITISFQGSVSNLDWLQNFAVWKKPYKRMENLFFVHAGFLKKYKAVQPEILHRIKMARDLKKHVMIRGYSQGAGLALLCHEDVVFNANYLPQTKVFGCPRVFSIFNSKLIQRRMHNLVRYQNGNDTVTKIPFSLMLFKHYGKGINIGRKRRWWKLSFKDHKTTNYKRSMEE
ncbi:lipase family protein [Candidatus Pacearchaeota archaeon]|nr:lipase family protein [Candidatus Pacearchaeota archaeon]